MTTRILKIFGFRNALDDWLRLECKAHPSAKVTKTSNQRNTIELNGGDTVIQLEVVSSVEHLERLRGLRFHFIAAHATFWGSIQSHSLIAALRVQCLERT